ncbi:hypothetical protein SAMN05216176_11773 [Nitratireductor indicus]|nr:hypothetical protein SAMN05216176_11773 [Nitratireductor indicus]
MTLWEFTAMRDGYLLAHGAKPKANPLSDDELKALGIEGA